MCAMILSAVLPTQAPASFLHVFMAAGIVVARTIFFFIIVVYLHSHTGLSLLATDSAELAAVVCGEPAIYHRRPSPTVLD